MASEETGLPALRVAGSAPLHRPTVWHLPRPLMYRLGRFFILSENKVDTPTSDRTHKILQPVFHSFTTYGRCAPLTVWSGRDGSPSARRRLSIEAGVKLQRIASPLSAAWRHAARAPPKPSAGGADSTGLIRSLLPVLFPATMNPLVRSRFGGPPVAKAADPMKTVGREWRHPAWPR